VIADALYGEVGRAYILKAGDVDLSAEDLKAWCAERLANFKIPKNSIFAANFRCWRTAKLTK